MNYQSKGRAYKKLHYKMKKPSHLRSKSRSSRSFSACLIRILMKSIPGRDKSSLCSTE